MLLAKTHLYTQIYVKNIKIYNVLLIGMSEKNEQNYFKR